MGNADNSVVKRNFRENPLTDEEVQYCYWYVTEDDTIGGWLIATVNKPASEINPYEGEFEVATFVKKTMAQHIVDLHNSWWDRFVWNSYYDNVEASYTKTVREFYAGAAPLPEGVAPMTEDEWFDYDEVDRRSSE